MRNIGRLLLSALVFCALLSAPAFADTCAAGNLSGLIGTTCDIGSLQFTFSGLSSIGNTPWSANDFTLTPVSNGFTLGFDGGAQSITAPAIYPYVAVDSAYLYYTVTDLGGNITGENVSGGALSASGTWGTYSTAEYYGSTPDSNSSAYVQPGIYVSQSNGTLYSGGYNYIYGSPFSTSGTAYAYPFYLEAEHGASAGWDGSPTTFTYTTDNPSPVPEPSSLLLLGTGLLGMAERIRHKLRG